MFLKSFVHIYCANLLSSLKDMYLHGVDNVHVVLFETAVQQHLHLNRQPSFVLEGLAIIRCILRVAYLRVNKHSLDQLLLHKYINVHINNNPVIT